MHALLKPGFAALLCLALAACSEQAGSPSGTEAAVTGQDSTGAAGDAAAESNNPFFQEWDTPYGIPPFDRIRNEDYRPAFERGIQQRRADIAAIRDNPEPPTFENTLVALELAGPLLTRVDYTFGNISNTDTNEELQALEVEINPLLTREDDAMYLDPVLFARVQTVWEQRDALALDEQGLRLVELTHREFLRRGAALDAEAKARLKEINARISELNTEFAQNLLKETNAFELVVTDADDLAGLPDNMIGSAHAKAEARGRPEAWVFGLDRGTFEGFMTFSDRRDLRGQMYAAYRARGGQGGPNDNRDITIEIVRLRAEEARLLGYPNFAAYQLDNRMAKTPEQAQEFLLEVWQPGLQKAADELAQMQAIAQAEGGDFVIEGQDWWYYAEKLRQQKYAIDPAVVKPYFELNNVRDGAFYVAGQLFGLRFEPLHDVPVWNPVVQPWVVYDAEGAFLGVFMADYYARDTKRVGAWTSIYRQASDIDGVAVRPIVTNNLNVALPEAGKPTLLSYDEVETLFHEFGHALHCLMTQIRYPRFAGTRGNPRDYTEFPSQFMEHYATEPQVLAVYARNAETGEIIPDELIAKLRAASTHNQGFITTEYIAASLLDLRWHSLTPEQAAELEDADRFEQETLDAFGKPPEIESRYRSPYFAHIFAGGYAAGYYAYLWSEILDADGFTAFEESGNVFDPELARRLKENVYQAGALRDADVLYRQFRGQDPGIGPLLEIRGLK